MCVKAISEIDFEATKNHVMETIKYLDSGKLLGVAGGLLELDPKAMVQKAKDKLTDEDSMLFIKSKVRLVSDILGWVPTYIEGLVGAIQGYKA